MFNRRTTIIIVIFLLLALGTAFYFIQKTNDQEQTQENNTDPVLAKIIDEPVIAPVPSFNGDAIWYFNSSGRLFRADSNGQNITEYPLPTINGLKNVFWPQTGNDFMAVAEYEGNVNAKHFYNNETNEYTILPYNVEYLDWMPDSKRIAYIWKSGDGVSQQLNISNADGTGYKTITSQIFWPDFKIHVSPGGEEALLVRSKIDGSSNKIYKVKFETGKIDTVVGTGKNLDALWVDNNRFIYTQSGLATYPSVYMINTSSYLISNLNLNTTLDKVVLDKEGQFLYAAVAKSDNSGDLFVKINLTTLVTETFYNPTEDVRAKNLHVVGNTLYFVNTTDGKLYSVKK